MNFTEKKYMFTTNKEVSVVNFYVNWCFYSRIQKLILNKFKQQTQEKIKVYNIDSDRNKKLAEKFEVNTFPSILIFKNGNVVECMWSNQFAPFGLKIKGVIMVKNNFIIC